MRMEPGDLSSTATVAASDIRAARHADPPVERPRRRGRPHTLPSGPKVLFVGPNGASDGQLGAYTDYLSGLLGGRVTRLEPRDDSGESELAAIETAARSHELVVLGVDRQPLLQRLLHGSLVHRILSSTTGSLLTASSPRWPIRRILAVTRGRPQDDAVSAWSARLACASGATITVLFVQPELPAACACCLPGVALAHGTTYGMRLSRQVASLDEHVPGWSWTGHVRCRSGSPCDQLRREIAEKEPDLVITGADARSWLDRRVTGCLTGELIRWAARPVLIARRPDA